MAYHDPFTISALHRVDIYGGTNIHKSGFTFKNRQVAGNDSIVALTIDDKVA